MHRTHFEDCHVGDRLITIGRTITEADIVQFASLSGDWNPLHTDAEYARQGPYGERVAHGMLSLAAGLNLLFRHGGFGNSFLPNNIVALTGLDRVQFKVPVKIGDTVRLACEIVEMRPVFERQGSIEVRFRVLNQRDETAVSGRVSVLALCRDMHERHEDR